MEAIVLIVLNVWTDPQNCLLLNIYFFIYFWVDFQKERENAIKLLKQNKKNQL